MKDKREPKLKKIGCFYQNSDETCFQFFNEKEIVKNGDLFVYNKGILFRIEL